MAMADDKHISGSSALDGDAFIALYDRHHRSVFAYIARRHGSDAAEELTAQTFTEAWASRHRYDPDRGTPIVWCLGIATNLMRKHERAEVKNLRILASTGVDPVDPMDEAALVARVAARDDLRSIAAVLADMDRTTRDAIYLWAAADLSYEEIAATLSIRIGTVRSKLSRARQKLSMAVDATETGRRAPHD